MDGRGVYPSRAAAEKLRIRRLVCRGGRERRTVCRRAGQRPRALERRSGRRGVRPLAGHGRYFIRAERGRKLYRRRRYGQGADRNCRARIPQRQARHGDCAGGSAKLCRFALAGGGCVCHVYRAGSAVRLRQSGNIGASVHRRLARCRRRGGGFGLPLRRNGVCKFRRSGAILQQYGLCLLLSPAKSARHCGDRCRCRRVRCVQRRFLFKERCAHRRIAGRKGVLRLRLARGYRARRGPALRRRFRLRPLFGAGGYRTARLRAGGRRARFRRVFLARQPHAALYRRECRRGRRGGRAGLPVRRFILGRHGSRQPKLCGRAGVLPRAARRNYADQRAAARHGRPAGAYDASERRVERRVGGNRQLCAVRLHGYSVDTAARFAENGRRPRLPKRTRIRARTAGGADLSRRLFAVRHGAAHAARAHGVGHILGRQRARQYPFRPENLRHRFARREL